MNAQIVSFNCILKTRFGQTISFSVNRDVLTVPPTVDAPLSGLARGLQNLTKGEKRSISLSAKDAYGFYDPQKVVPISRHRLADISNIRMGQFINLPNPANGVQTFKIVQIIGDQVLLDGNHPLAGQDLIFEIEAIDVREATMDELNETKNPLASQQLH